MGTLVRVDGPDFAAGLVLDDQERCTHSAPILRWAVGMTREDLRAEFERLGLRASVIGEGDRLPPALSAVRPGNYVRRA
jgi:hypothetical protein